MSVTGTAGGRIAPGVGANLIGQHAQDRNQEATVYVGNLDVQVTEELVWELFTQAGPVVNVYMPKDRVTSQHQGYGFVEFKGEEDADYAIKILNMIKMYGKAIRVNKASQDKRQADVGANLFIGNLDPDVDEKLLYDTFSAFGVIVNTPKIMRDPETGNSRGFGFVSYDCFEASDAAIEAMNGQYLCNRAITVSYAFKKDTKGERHGTPAERLLAAQQREKMAAQSRPNQLFAEGPKLKGQQAPHNRRPVRLVHRLLRGSTPRPRTGPCRHLNRRPCGDPIRRSCHRLLLRIRDLTACRLLHQHPTACRHRRCMACSRRQTCRHRHHQGTVRHRRRRKATAWAHRLACRRRHHQDTGWARRRACRHHRAHLPSRRGDSNACVSKLHGLVLPYTLGGQSGQPTGYVCG
ncbi:hypothetical protein Vretimale_2469 [Volvox reticuliferus]|nr:hypothetical protein Vretimale_2469 [Volvox reticuliferus]